MTCITIHESLSLDARLQILIVKEVRRDCRVTFNLLMILDNWNLVLDRFPITFAACNRTTVSIILSDLLRHTQRQHSPVKH